MNIASKRHILVRTKAKFDESFSGTKLRTSIYLRGEERKTKKKSKTNICIHITTSYINVECTIILKKQANCLL